MLTVVESGTQRGSAQYIPGADGSFAEPLNPNSTNQSGFLNFAVAGNEWQARDSGLCDNETVIGIRKSCKGGGLKQQLHVVDAQ